MHIGSGNHTQVLHKSSKCSRPLSCPSSPCLRMQPYCASLPHSFVWTSSTESLFRNWDQVLGLGLAGSPLLPLVICFLSPRAPLLLRHSLTERRPLPCLPPPQDSQDFCWYSLPSEHSRVLRGFCWVFQDSGALWVTSIPGCFAE